jgi:hypothetical protein
MAISAVAVTTTDTLETFRVEFNNLVADVASLEQVGAANIIISDGGNIGSASDQDALAIAANGVVTFSQAPSFTTGLLVSDLDIDGSTDIGAAIVDADLFIVDDGASGTNRKTAASRIKTYIADVTLTTAAQTAITSVGTLTALDVDNININGNTISASSGAVNITPAGGSAIVLDGTVNVDAGVVTGVTSLTSNNILIADDGTIGSASDTDAIAIAANGVVTMNQIPVFSAGINVSGGNIAGTLSTAAQTNITSVGTLTALTVDDVAINGKVITMTGSSSDTAVFTVGTNGTLSIVTTDDSAAAANIQITADGTAELAGTTVTLDSGGDIVLDADGADVIFKDGGTTILSFTNSSSDAVITSGVQDKDIIFKGDDGGSAITALTLDMSAAGAATFNGAITGGGLLTTGGNIVIPDDGNIGSASDTDAIAIAANGVVTFSQAVSGTSADFDGGVTIDNITIDGTEIDLSSGDLTVDVAGDIILDADGGDFKFQDGGTEILRITNSSSDVIIRPVVDAKDIIFQQRDGTEVARIEDNGTFNVVTDKFAINGTAVTATAAELNLIDGGTSRGTTAIADGDGVLINDDGTMRMTTVQTLAAYLDDEITAMPNLTSVGTLTALTVDDVAVNGKAITMTGSTDDTAVFTVGTNGTLTIETTDTAAAAANIQVTADGTFEVDATTITLDSAGDIVLDADGANVTFKDAGTAIGDFSNSSSDFVITASVQDKDIIFKGDYGGSAITALTLDMSAAGAATFNSSVTSGAGLIIADGGNIGSASDPDAIAIAADGVVTMNQIPVFSAGINVSGGSIAGTLSTAAQTNITSLGTLTALTVYNSSTPRIEVGYNGTQNHYLGWDGAKLHFQADPQNNNAASAIIFSVDGSEAMRLAAGGIATFVDDIKIKNGGTIGSASDADSITIASDGQVTLSQNLTITGEVTTTGFSSTDFAAAFIVIEDGGTDGSGTDAGDNLIDETDSDDLLMENVTSWVTSGFTIRDSFGNHLQTVNGVS